MSSSPSYLTKNRLGVFILQIRVPADIRQKKPDVKPLIRRSLRTRNRHEALRAARKMVVWMEENEFDIDRIDREARRDTELFHVGKPLFEELNRLWSEGDQLALDSFLVDLSSTEEDALRYMAEQSNKNIDRFEQLLEAGDRQKTAEFLLELPRLFKKPLRDVLNRHIATHNPSSPVPPNASETTILDAIKNQHKAHVNSIPLTKAIDEFCADKRRSGSWTDETTEEHYREDIFALLHELFGDIRTGDLEKSHSRLYMSAVLKMPSNRNKSPKYRDFTIQQLMEMEIPENDIISITTKKKYISRFSGFLRWLQKHDYVIANLYEPFQKLFPNDDSAENEKRNQYTCDDLRKLYNSKQYTQGLHTEAYRFWVPLIGLFTGARENEICQLHLNDVYQYDNTGIWVLDINQDDKENTKKSIKKGYHDRLIPIHPMLIKLGFIDSFQSINPKRQTRLFPELVYHKKNKYGYLMQKWFNKTYTNKNNCNIETPDTSFHSLRHTLETYLANKLEMPIHKVEVMMGQKPRGGVSTTRYIKPIELKDRFDYIKRVDFRDCIDFHSIRLWRHHRFTK